MPRTDSHTLRNRQLPPIRLALPGDWLALAAQPLAADGKPPLTLVRTIPLDGVEAGVRADT